MNKEIELKLRAYSRIVSGIRDAQVQVLTPFLINRSNLLNLSKP